VAGISSAFYRCGDTDSSQENSTAALGSLPETGAAEVLPTLQTILKMGSQSDLFHVTELLNPFTVARDQANCPVTVKIIDSGSWERDYWKRDYW